MPTTKEPENNRSALAKKNARQPDLDTPVQFLKGVGPRIAVLLDGKGVRTIRDSVFFLPRDYQDRSTLKPIAMLRHEEKALVRGRILSHHYIPIRSMPRPLLEARIQDSSGTMSIKWFQYNRTYMDPKLRGKPSIIAYGTVRQYNGKLEMIHPDIDWEADETDVAGSERILPLYSESEGLNQKLIRKIVAQALDLALDLVPDDLPLPVLEKHKLVPLTKALHGLHRPEKSASIAELRAFNTPEQRRLIFDELFKFEWVVGRKRMNMRREHTKPYPKEAGLPQLAKLMSRLPFELTEDQRHAIDKIIEDLALDKPMNRLLQGDVGCGKTLVAFCSALSVTAAGGQVALMAPTEILAEQHLKNALKTLDGIVEVGWLTGSTPKAKRDEILARLAAGKTGLLIGTHALLEDPVGFKELGLVIIDEQHRFGVDQRMRLRAKGTHPHVLSLTATPIPRTLALTAYGDLDVSIIRQMPKGRPEVHTSITKSKERESVLQQARTELEKGRQAYVIFPLVEESEKVDLANAISGAEELANGPFKGFRVGLLHGRMKPFEKSAVMEAFKAGETHVLVSTTVVEVGVDVPNATVMVIEHAERFGLSQLHQLRGRIGRGTKTSYCFLVTAGASREAFDRLHAMEQTRDGFRLAELDLKFRGPGEFLGTRQSGELQFQYASLVRDQLILEEARKAAFSILKLDPELEAPENRPLRLYMERSGHLQQKRFETA